MGFKDDGILSVTFEGERIEGKDSREVWLNSLKHFGIEKAFNVKAQHRNYLVIRDTQPEHSADYEEIDGYYVWCSINNKAKAKTIKFIANNLNLKVEVAFSEAEVIVNGERIEGEELKEIFLNTLKKCGLKRVYDLHIPYNNDPTAKEDFDIIDINPHPRQHYAGMQKSFIEDGVTYFVIDSMRTNRKKAILREIGDRLDNYDIIVQ